MVGVWVVVCVGRSRGGIVVVVVVVVGVAAFILDG